MSARSQAGDTFNLTDSFKEEIGGLLGKYRIPGLSIAVIRKKEDEGVGQTTYWNKGDGLYLAAAGGMWSTANDMLIWLKELLDPKILPKATVAEINRPRAAWTEMPARHPTLSMMHYGIGQYTQYYRGHRLVGHIGGMPGHYSMVIRLPDDDIGFALFINDETFGFNLNNVISFKLIDELLKIKERVDWEEMYMLKGLREQPVVEIPPSSPRDSRDISGKYNHGAYGDLNISRIEDHPMGNTFIELLKEYPGNTIPLQPDVQVYLGDLPHDLAGKLLFTSFDGPIFTRAFIKAEDVQPLDKSDKRKYAAHVYGIGKCVAVEDGIGMFEDFWGQGGAVDGMEVRKCVEEGVEEKAEVWFRKIS